MQDVIAVVGEEFEKWSMAPNGYPRLLHKLSGILFQYVPAGTYVMGLSEHEEAAARALSPVLQANVEEMKPPRTVSVGASLVSATPVLNCQTGQAIGKGEFAFEPAHFGRVEAEQFAAKGGFRLPTECEWEYFCRGGTKTLFPFGDLVPSDKELKQWLSPDFSTLDSLRSNAFGLYGLFNPEWCQDQFKVSLAEDAPLLDGSYVIRGGGAYFWPWQDEEWVWCMSAMRSPSSSLQDGMACLRLVQSVR